MSEKRPFLVAVNTHAESCGDPPEWAVNAVPGYRRFYGENCFGEQLIALAGYDGVRFAGGDLYWGEEKPVSREVCLQAKEEGLTQAAIRKATHLVLNKEEALLLAAAFSCCCDMPAPTSGSVG